VLIAGLALRGIRIDGTSPAHASDESIARVVDRDGSGRFIDRGGYAP